MENKIIIPLRVYHQRIVGYQSVPRIIVEKSRLFVYVEFEFDEDWDNLAIEVIFSNDNAQYKPVSQSWHGQPLEIPAELLVTGEVKLSCIGRDSHGGQITTLYMNRGIRIDRSGEVLGYAAGPGDNRLWEQTMAAVGSLANLQTQNKDNLVVSVAITVQLLLKNSLNSKSVKNQCDLALV